MITKFKFYARRLATFSTPAIVYLPRRFGMRCLSWNLGIVFLCWEVGLGTFLARTRRPMTTDERRVVDDFFAKQFN